MWLPERSGRCPWSGCWAGRGRVVGPAGAGWLGRQGSGCWAGRRPVLSVGGVGRPAGAAGLGDRPLVGCSASIRPVATGGVHMLLVPVPSAVESAP